MRTPRPELPRPKLLTVPSSAEVASDYIRTLVFTGVLRTGDKVPVEEIAQVLGVSRQPVREALIDLSSDGLVRTDGRRGTFVADFGPATIRDHYELYGLLQSFALRRVAHDAAPTVLGSLRAIEVQARSSVDVAEISRLAIEFARVVNKAAGNARLRLVMRAMSRFTPGEYYLANVPDALKRNRTHMREELRAIESGDPDRAAAVGLKMWVATGEALISHLRSTGVFLADTAPAPTSATTATNRRH